MRKKKSTKTGNQNIAVKTNGNNERTKKSWCQQELWE